MDITTISNRLADFGYMYNEEKDGFAVTFAVDKITNHILHETNCSEIDASLIQIAVDMVCAEFLKLKKGFGQLTDMEFELVAQTIRLGDANVQFTNEATPEQKFETALNYLLSGHEADFAACRKMVW